jgi:hypothetical protein
MIYKKTRLSKITPNCTKTDCYFLLSRKKKLSPRWSPNGRHRLYFRIAHCLL